MNLGHQPMPLLPEQKQFVDQLVNSAATTAGALANEFTRQTLGLFELPPSNYAVMVGEFWHQVKVRLQGPPKTQEDLDGEIKKYIEKVVAKVIPPGSEEDKVIQEERARRAPQVQPEAKEKADDSTSSYASEGVSLG